MLPRIAATPPEELAARLASRIRRLLDDGRPEDALPMLDRLGALPDQARPAGALRAEALLQLTRLDDAEAAATAALEAGDDDPALRRLRARIRLTRGAAIAAIDDAAAAVMAEPAERGGRLLLGAALLEDGRFDEAIWFLGGALRADPDNPALQARLGQAFMLAGRHDAAAELLAHCQARTPDHPGIAALRAQAALLAGDLAAAESLARAALGGGRADAAAHSVLAHALVSAGRLTEAAPHFAAASRLVPQDAYLAHLAAATGGGVADRAPDAYVAGVFDGYAGHFESEMIALGYRVPGLIRRTVERLRPDVASAVVRLGPVLDLGCGTGLVGVALADLLDGPLTGIDLSPAMLRQARAKGVYTRLREAELIAGLEAETAPQALITAGDVFCYLGGLEAVLALCRQRLAPGGLLVFSVERAPPGTGWRLGPQGRFAHAADYVADVLAAAGLRLLEAREEPIRRDAGAPLPGLLVAAGAAVH